MSETELAAKMVESALLDTWSRGPALQMLFTDKGPVTRGGDSLDIGTDDDGPTIHGTEAADPESVAMNRFQLVVDTPKFVNRAVSVVQMAQLLNGTYAQEMVRSNAGYFKENIDEFCIDKALQDLVLARHLNIANAAVTKAMFTRAEAKMLSRPGILEQDIYWLLSPASAATAGDLYPDVTPLAVTQAFDLGKPIGRSLNGVPMFRHSGVPGYKRRAKAIIASSITANVATLTMEDANHGFQDGQLARTLGLQVDSAAAGAVIATVAGPTITIPLTAANDADNGTGVLQTCTAFAMLMAKSRCYYASDQVIPQSQLLKRTDAAGYTHQLFQHVGAKCKDGGVYVMHMPLVEADD